MLAETSDPSAVGGLSPEHGGTSPWLSTPPPASGPTVEQHEKELFAPYCTLDEPVRDTIMRDVNAVWAKLKIVLLPLDRFAYPFQYMALASSSPNQDTPSTTTTTDDGNNNGGLQPQPQQQVQSPTNNNSTTGDLSDNDRKVIQSLKDWDLWGPLILCLSLSVLLSLKAPKKDSSLVFAAVFCSVWAGGSVVTINAQLLGGTISFFQSLCVMGYSTFPLVIAAFIIGCLKIFINTWVWFDLLFVVPGYLWSVRVSAVFLGLYIKQERRFLALYPVFFYYSFLSWMILVF
ncbi:hypothetical protein ACA910_013624 [Epithemia clementina (nom. ined.)]